MKDHPYWIASSISRMHPSSSASSSTTSTSEEGTYTSSCGHSMHQRCIQKFISEVHDRVINFKDVDSDKVEFFCPICRHLANFVLPKDFVNREAQSGNIINQGINSLRLPQAVDFLQSTSRMVIDLGITISSLQRNTVTFPILQSMSRLVSKMHFRPNDNLCPSLMLWEAIAFSLKSMEVASRSGSLSLNTLFREVESPTGFALSRLVKIARKLETTNDHVLLRYNGFRLLSMSICWGISLESLKFWIGENQVQYWNQASDPILTRDPFSSLMWVLFCLPSSSITCDENFLSLLHVFYDVNVAQSLIIFYAKRRFNMSDSKYFIINYMCKVMKEYGFAQHFFNPSYDEQSSDIVDVIRKLSFSYLRRCGLLWKLMTSPKPVPFSENDQVMHTVDSDVTELEGIKELEAIFKIPSIDNILEDVHFISLVMKWLYHFGKGFESRMFQGVFYSAPAVPFKLIKLPQMYDHLLRRYINEPCPECHMPILEPALCLFCEKLCEADKDKPCCSESQCTNHVKGCGAGIGVFLLIKRTTIQLQRFDSWAPWPSPYLDELGSQDVEMLRGVPLFLNEERYVILANMVASHRLCTEVFNNEPEEVIGNTFGSTDSDSDLMDTDSDSMDT